MKQVRLGISHTIYFLSTWVTKSIKVDWIKLKRLLGYLNNTIDMPRIICMDGLAIMKPYIDVSYAVHPDMRGHSGGLISIGKGVLHIKINKQKLNTNSSTDTELVAANDCIPWAVWITKVLLEQRYFVKINYQDNESAIKIERYGLIYYSDKSRHTNIRYFFIKNTLHREGISVEHCRTGDMIEIFVIKPLQGSIFKRMTCIIMEHSPFQTEEYVGKYINNETINEQTEI